MYVLLKAPSGEFLEIVSLGLYQTEAEAVDAMWDDIDECGVYVRNPYRDSRGCIRTCTDEDDLIEWVIIKA